jgi:hypothetical protein
MGVIFLSNAVKGIHARIGALSGAKRVVYRPRKKMHKVVESTAI